MTTTQATTSSHVDTLTQKHDQRSVVYFRADWCGPCKELDQIVEVLADDYREIQFITINADDEEHNATLKKHNVTAIPKVVLTHSGKQVDSLEGADPQALKQKVHDLRNKPSMHASANERATALTCSNEWVVFMKGTPKQPRCGFSRRVVDALSSENIQFITVDVSQDEEVREELKKISEWPTYPQVYHNGELVGGCDIVEEMHQFGDLSKSLQQKDSGEAGTEGRGVGNGKAELTQRIEKAIRSSRVVVFMKGKPSEPRCGFSRKVVDALGECKVEFSSVDILNDDELREGLKQYSEWKTYPQVYANGELVGGCDIVLELYNDNALGEALM